MSKEKFAVGMVCRFYSDHTYYDLNNELARITYVGGGGGCKITFLNPNLNSEWVTTGFTATSDMLHPIITLENIYRLCTFKAKELQK